MNADKNSEWFLHLKLLDSSSQGYSVHNLGEMFDQCAATINRHIRSFNEASVAGLRSSYGQGRSPELDRTKAQWLGLLAKSMASLERLNLAVQIGARQYCSNIPPTSSPFAQFCSAI